MRDKLGLTSAISQIRVMRYGLVTKDPHPLSCRMEWRETARWVKFEEDVEEGGDKWSKPHVATLSLHSLFELRSCIFKGTVLLDLQADNLAMISGKDILVETQLCVIYGTCRIEIHYLICTYLYLYSMSSCTVNVPLKTHTGLISHWVDNSSMAAHTGLISHWVDNSSMATHTGLISHWVDNSSMATHTGLIAHWVDNSFMAAHLINITLG